MPESTTCESSSQPKAAAALPVWSQQKALPLFSEPICSLTLSALKAHCIGCNIHRKGTFCTK